MSTTSNPPSMLRRLLIWSLITATLVGGIWIAVVLWWQSSQRQITTEDVLVYLVALPLVALFSLAVLQWLRHRKRQSSAPSLSVTPPSESQPGADEHAPEPSLPIISAWAVTSIAENTADFLQALLEKRQRPRPDATLQDDYGFPLHTGRISNLDTEYIQEELEQIASTQPEGMPSVDLLSSAFLRSMALLGQLINQLSSDWPLMTEADDATASQAGTSTLRGQETIANNVDQRLQLQVKLLLSAGLNSSERRLVQAYLEEKITIVGAGFQQLQIDLIPASDDATVLSLAEQFRKELLHAPRPQALLLLACESTLCDSITTQWQNAGRLFGSQTPGGLMPGEAAFAILFTNDKALPLSLLGAACHLSATYSHKRETSADSAGKPSSSTLIETINRVLTNAGINGESIGAVACDADHRTSRILECVGAMMHHTPQLDAVANRLAVNEACGHTGAASVAGSLVAGIAQARDSDYPVLLFNVCHLFERTAALLIPTSDQPKPS